MDEIFEPRPSTSSDDIPYSRDFSRPRGESIPGAGGWVYDRGPRKLSIVPRTSQYERHPLLQERSDTGLSGFEELTNMLHRQKTIDTVESYHRDHVSTARRKLLFENTDSGAAGGKLHSLQENASSMKQRSKSVEGDHKSHREAAMAVMNSSNSSQNNKDTRNNHSNKAFVDPHSHKTSVCHENTKKAEVGHHTALRRLEPRGALAEKHPLLEKSESGMSELEMYLFEKEQEILLACQGVGQHGHTNFKTIDHHDDDENYNQRLRGPLLPRQNQYEKHALLENRDERGLSPLDHFLCEKENLVGSSTMDPPVIDQEEDSTGSKGKCSEKSVCKNANCATCKPNQYSNSAMFKSSKKSSSTTKSHSLDHQQPLSSNVPKAASAAGNHETKKQKLTDCNKEGSEQEISQKIPLLKYDNEEREGGDAVINQAQKEEAVKNTDEHSNDTNYIHANQNGGGDSYEQYSSSEYEDVMGGHPPLMKKESSRETMIEPKETNKRVHFERTLSDKERERIAQLNNLPNADNKVDKNSKVNSSDNEKCGRSKFWAWCGSRTSNTDRQDTELKVVDEHQVGQTVESGREPKAAMNETEPLVNDSTANTQTTNKDKNENQDSRKNQRKKTCNIL